MIYIFDTGSFSKLKHYYPGVFSTLWTGLDGMVKSGTLISTKEVRRELENGSPDANVDAWIKANAQIFTTPNAQELAFVASILAIKHFQSIIGEQQRLKGTPVADPFVIAAAMARKGTVVTEEAYKPNSAKIPNICEHMKVACTNLEGFMSSQSWSF
ncbi:PIN domain-containing protein [Stenotrophomonas bentonitica]